MRPLIWDFFKTFKSGKNVRDAGVCLGGADQLFQILINQKSPPPKLSTVEKNDSQYRRQGHEMEEERESLIISSST